MLPCCQTLLLVAFTISITVAQTSAFSPNRGISKPVASIPGPLDKARTSPSSSTDPRQLSKMGDTPKTYIRTQGAVSLGSFTLKFSLRGPDCQLLPIHVSAVALQAFYASIAHSASTVWSQTESAGQLFTLTQGALQLSMSGLGTAVPWKFVEDWALSAAISVMRGWTCTFDEVYEIEGTGISVWVSLRLLER